MGLRDRFWLLCAFSTSEVSRLISLQYLLSFLDRGNIGNAKIEGLAEDLHLKGGQYNWCLTGMHQPISHLSSMTSAQSSH